MIVGVLIVTPVEVTGMFLGCSSFISSGQGGSQIHWVIFGKLVFGILGQLLWRVQYFSRPFSVEKN